MLGTLPVSGDGVVSSVSGGGTVNCALWIIQWYPAWAAGSGCLVRHICLKAKQADVAVAAEIFL